LVYIRNNDNLCFILPIMSGIDLSQPLLGAGASAKTDFAAAQARTGLNFMGEARFKRGIKAELGLEAFVDASAEFSKFVRASIEGTAFARAQAGVQLQLALNLFDEFGFSARAEAIAEAAAGIRASLGLSIGDFILLARQDSKLVGVPLEIFLLLMEEVSIGGEFEVNVAASAKAHASISVAGTIIEQGGDKAGFYYTIDAGVGLAAGVGMGLKAGLEFKDFRRFYGRAVDKSVDSTLEQVSRYLPRNLLLEGSQQAFRPMLEVFSPVAKIAFRIAYDVGLKITTYNPGHSSQDTSELCNAAIQTFLEEMQRYILEKTMALGLEELQRILEQEILGLATGKWDSVKPVRMRIANHLRQIPTEPFQPTVENINYWKVLTTEAIALIVEIGEPDPDLYRSITVLYCSTELAMEAIRSKVNTASAYAVAVGAGKVQTNRQPFVGALQSAPPQKIEAAIRSVIGSSASLTYADLVHFLIHDFVVDPLVAGYPDLANMLGMFSEEMMLTEHEILKLFLQHASAFDPSNPSNAEADPRDLLAIVIKVFDKYVDNRFKSEVLPLLLSRVTDPVLKLYLEEVLYPAAVFIKDVGLHAILHWDQLALDNETFTESLAGVIMLLLGRSIVVVADSLVLAAQNGVSLACDDLAGKLTDFANDPQGSHPEAMSILPQADPEMIRLVARCVRIGGKVLGSLDSSTRERIRALLYQVFEVIPPGKEGDFLEKLGDDFFIPNVDDLNTVTLELAEIAKTRFGLFAKEFIQGIGLYILEQLEAFILAAIDLVVNWEKHLAQRLLDLAAQLKNLENSLLAINHQLADALVTSDTSLRRLFQVLQTSSLRNKVRLDIREKFVNKTLDELRDNTLYGMLPSNFQTGFRNAAKDAVDAAMDNGFVQTIFNLIADVADQMESLMPNVRELDPDDNLPEQLMLLILDKVEDNIRDHFGSEKPYLSINLRYSFLEWQVTSVIPPRGGWIQKHLDIQLGRVRIDLTPFINLVRSAILALDSYHDVLNEACFDLARVFARELELAAKRLSKEDRTKELNRAEVLDREHNNQPKEIAILSPRNFDHFSANIQASIFFGGVSSSYLGLGRNEAQRILIYCNGHLIPPKSLVIDDSQIGVSFDKSHNQNLSLDKEIFSTRKSVIISNTAKLLRDQGKQIAEDEKVTRMYGVTFGIPNSNAGIPKSRSGSEIYTTLSATRKAGRPSVYQHEVFHLPRGSSVEHNKIERFLNDRQPGLMIRFRINYASGLLVEGVNALTVVVIEKGGDRHQQQVCFTYSSHPNTNRPTLGSIVFDPVLTNKTPSPVLSLRNLVQLHKKEVSFQDLRMEKVKLDRQPAHDVPKQKMFHQVEIPMVQHEIHVRHETLQVVKRLPKGKERNIGQPIEISYDSASERRQLIAKLGLNSKVLAAMNQRIVIVKISSSIRTYRNESDSVESSVKVAGVIAQINLAKDLSDSAKYLENQYGLNFKNEFE
jgi:hypothetical protein